MFWYIVVNVHKNLSLRLSMLQWLFFLIQGYDGFKGDKGNIGLPGNPGEPGLRGKDVSKAWVVATVTIDISCMI